MPPFGVSGLRGAFATKNTHSTNLPKYMSVSVGLVLISRESYTTDLFGWAVGALNLALLSKTGNSSFGYEASLRLALRAGFPRGRQV